MSRRKIFAVLIRLMVFLNKIVLRLQCDGNEMPMQRKTGISFLRQ